MKKEIITLKITDDQARALQGVINMIMERPGELATTLAYVEEKIYKEERGLHMLLAFTEFMEQLTVEIHKHKLCSDPDCPDKKDITTNTTSHGRKEGARRESRPFSWDQLKR